MLENTKRFMSEHKAEIIFGMSTMAVATLGVLIGYKAGCNKGLKEINKLGKDTIPGIIAKAGFHGHKVTIDAIEEYVPEAYELLIKTVDKDNDIFNSHLILNLFLDDEWVKDAAKFADKLAAANHL